MPHEVAIHASTGSAMCLKFTLVPFCECRLAARVGGVCPPVLHAICSVSPALPQLTRFAHALQAARGRSEAEPQYYPPAPPPYARHRPPVPSLQPSDLIGGVPMRAVRQHQQPPQGSACLRVEYPKPSVQPNHCLVRRGDVVSVAIVLMCDRRRAFAHVREAISAMTIDFQCSAQGLILSLNCPGLPARLPGWSASLKQRK